MNAVLIYLAEWFASRYWLLHAMAKILFIQYTAPDDMFRFFAA